MNKTEKEIISDFYKLLVTRNKHEINELLSWTIGTFYKGYDNEEEEECVIEDTINWLHYKADYMKITE